MVVLLLPSRTKQVQLREGQLFGIFERILSPRVIVVCSSGSSDEVLRESMWGINSP